MKIIIDGFGGDNSPIEVIKGCAMAVKDYGVKILLTGSKKIIESVSRDHNIDLSDIEIFDCKDVIKVEDEASVVLDENVDSSIRKGLELLSSGAGDAFVSAGSTSAVVVGSSFIVKRIKKIKRAVLAPIIPHDKGCYILVDGGANIECRPEMLLQFGFMGSIYMNKVMGIKKPRVGLLNIGAEETKGTDLYIDSHKLIGNSNLNFVGNVEARHVPLGICDVLVCDGFNGNIVLKLTEGLGKSLSNSFKGLFKGGFRSSLSALLIRDKLMAFKKKMDYTEYGGACLMGIRKPIIKAHGSSNANAFKNAIRQARDFVQNNVISDIEKSLSNIDI